MEDRRSIDAVSVLYIPCVYLLHNLALILPPPFPSCGPLSELVSSLLSSSPLSSPKQLNIQISQPCRCSVSVSRPLFFWSFAFCLLFPFSFPGSGFCFSYLQASKLMHSAKRKVQIVPSDQVTNDYRSINNLNIDGSPKALSPDPRNSDW